MGKSHHRHCKTLTVNIKGDRHDGDARVSRRPIRPELWEVNAYQSPNLPHGRIPLDPKRICYISMV